MKFLVVMTVFTGLVIACGDSNSHILGGDSGSKTAPLSPGNASGGENSGGGNTSGGNSGGNGGGYISDQFCIHPEEINDISDINPKSFFRIGES